MSRAQLLELATLDALGALDEYEATLFTRTFHRAPPSLQAEILKHQADVASDGALLPDVAPRSELRADVISAVLETVESESEGLAPLAAIGVAGTPARESRPRHAFASANQVWRAAAFLLAATVIVGFYFGLQLLETNRNMAHYVTGDVNDRQIESIIGPQFRAFAEDPTGSRFVLVATEASDDPARTAVIFVNEETNEAYLFAVGLDKDQYNRPGPSRGWFELRNERRVARRRRRRPARSGRPVELERRRLGDRRRHGRRPSPHRLIVPFQFALQRCTAWVHPAVFRRADYSARRAHSDSSSSRSSCRAVRSAWIVRQRSPSV